jgi:hypothetical protein
MPPNKPLQWSGIPWVTFLACLKLPASEWQRKVVREELLDVMTLGFPYE